MTRSLELFATAQYRIPGGVNSPVRAFHGVGGIPIFFERAAGPYLFDVDGKRYLDYVGSWGPLILGHDSYSVVAAVTKQAGLGFSFGAPTELEIRMADQLCQLVPSLDLVRMVNSGTEATMSAIRLARGYTGRDMLVKFEGCYHGHSDSLLVAVGSGALTLGQPSSPGVPAALAELTVTLSYNDLDQVRDTFARIGDRIAAIIVEPVAGNMGCIPPVPGFLQGLRALCDQYGGLLIFDEVMTGFRVALGGAQTRYRVTPDLTTLGKIIGGGLPVGAFGGRRDIMERIAPLGPVYQAGTLSGNPVAMAAGLATLEIVSEPGFYRALETDAERLVTGLTKAAATAGVPLTANRVGSMFSLFFTDAGPVTDFAGATACNQEQFRAFFHSMLDRSIYLAPSAFETDFLSAVHSDRDITATLDAAAEAFSLVP